MVTCTSCPFSSSDTGNGSVSDDDNEQEVISTSLNTEPAAITNSLLDSINLNLAEYLQ